MLGTWAGGVARGGRGTNGGFRFVYLLETIVAGPAQINFGVTFTRVGCGRFCGKPVEKQKGRTADTCGMRRCMAAWRAICPVGCRRP